MGWPPVVAVEIGTSKVVALVGELREDAHIMITGLGEHPSAGVRKGEVIDFDNALVCVRAALAAAEETSRVTIRQVHLALSGGHIQTLVNRGTFPVLDPAAGVTDEDVKQVTGVARTVNLPTERVVLHSIGQIFYVDGERVGRPEGLEGARLALDMLVLHAKSNQVHNTIRVLQEIPMDVADVAFSGLCSALAVLTPEQKEIGVLVIDLGGGMTDYVAYAANTFAAAGAIGLGGDHVTNDIVLAFNMPRGQAERLKRESGSALVEDKPHSRRVALPAEVGYHAGRSIPLAALQTVVHLRLAEMLGIIRRRSEEEGILHQLGAGVILTGGGANLKGVRELAERVFRLPCAIGKPQGISGLAAALEGPQYAAAAGLIRYAFKNALTQEPPSGMRKWFRRVLGRPSPGHRAGGAS